MDTDQLLVWLELVPADAEAPRSGMICRRHADAMVVPRGWTLDDRRESRPRLFKVPEATSAGRTRPGRAPRPRHDADADPPPQLAFGEADAAAPEPGAEASAVPDPPFDDIEPDEITVGDIRPLDVDDPDATRAMPWRPVFDDADDLGGLLRASTPLLSRAFKNRADGSTGGG
jgi:hypothetical protein